MADPQPDDISVHAPVGLRAYTADDTPLYGRDWERSRLRALLLAERVVLLYAPSGAGKTSLVQAGLVADLGGDTRLHLIKDLIRVNTALPAWAAARPEPPNRYLVSTLLSLDALEPDAPPPDGTIPSLAEALLTIADPGDSPRPLVLIFDQFEQILTEDPLDISAKQAFFKAFGNLLRDPRYWALLVIREDYLAALDPYLPSFSNQLRARFRLDLLDYQTARDVLAKTAADTGVDFAPEAVENLVDQLRRIRPRSSPGDLPAQASAESRAANTPLAPYVEPVYLQAVYERIWRRLRAQASNTTARMAMSDVERFVDIEAILADYYNDRLALVLSAAADAATGRTIRDLVSERYLRGWIEEKLIHNGLRTQLRLGANEAIGVPTEVIRSLSDQYLVRIDPRRGAWVELAHDLLIEPVLRSNAAWVEANTQNFQRQAALWEQRDSDASLLLLDRAQLHAARRWATANPPIDDRDQRFLDESVKKLRKDDATERSTDLAALGWGVFFHRDVDPAVRAAIQPLLDYRKAMIGDDADTYREFEYVPRPSRARSEAQSFLDAKGITFGADDRRKVPYYLLIVGGPKQIPFEFQYDLSLNQYAVGRLALDTPADYAHYVARLIAAEAGHAHRRTAALFTPEYPSEPAAAQDLRDLRFISASKQATDYLARPLYQRLTEGADDGSKWQIAPYFAEEPATRLKTPDEPKTSKSHLLQILGGSATPSLLFVAAQGFVGRDGQAPPLDRLGAIVCADWPGLDTPSADHYVAASDLEHGADLAGLIGVFFVPYSAGVTPADDTRPRANEGRLAVVDTLTTALSGRLLSAQPNPAMALIAHVNLNWNFSFVSADPHEPSDISLFARCIERLQRGHTVGRALEPFTQRYWELSLRIAAAVATRYAEGPLVPTITDEANPDAREVEIQNLRARLIENDPEVIQLLRARNDVRNYIILGDPAAHFSFEDDP